MIRWAGGWAMPAVDRAGQTLRSVGRPLSSPDPDVGESSSHLDRQDIATVTRLRPLPTVRRPRTFYVAAVKPAFDRVLAGLGLVVAAVPMGLIVASIKVTMGAPVLFRQPRVGRDGEVFDVLKFRTMRPDRRRSSSPVAQDRRITHKTSADPRHTALGGFLRKYSLDELPQLINVARGDMSIVGPRPEIESVVAEYPKGLDQRHYVKPGLTGLWQISARGDGPMHLNGEWDIEYVKRVSFLTDLSIVLRTPRAMFGERLGS